MIDIAALRADLARNTAYDSDVRGGHNGQLLRILMAEDDTLPRRWRPVSRDDFLSAIASETLMPGQELRVQTYTQDGQAVPMHKRGVRDWVLVQRFSSATVQALEAVGQVTGKPADAFLGDDDDGLTLRGIKIVIGSPDVSGPKVAKAHINQPASRPPRVAPPTR